MINLMLNVLQRQHGVRSSLLKIQYINTVQRDEFRGVGGGGGGVNPSWNPTG